MSLPLPMPPRRPRVAPLCLACLLGLGVAHAADPRADDHHYLIQPGDTLIGIGKRLLEAPRDWRAVRRHNRIAEPRRLSPGATLRIPLPLLRREAVGARVAAVTGDVTADDRKIAAGADVGGGTRIATGTGSFATIELVDGSRLVLQPDSRIKLDELSRHRYAETTETRLRLERGRLESVVVKTPRARPHFSVIMPTATVGVRGTRFRVAAEAPGSASRAEVTDGTVAVGDGGKGTAVPAGYGVLAEADGKVSPPIALLPAPELAGLPAVQDRTIARFVFPPVAGARQYRLQIGADADMRTVLAEARSAKPEAKFADLPDGQYTLRVRGIDDHGLEGRDADAPFSVKARPEPPFALTPVGGAKLRGESVELAWSSNPDASHYQVQLADAAGFDRPFMEIERVDGTAVAPARKLPPGDYRWRARSIRADGDRGPWGDTQRFVLKPPPADPEPPKVGEDQIAFAWAGEPGQTFLFQLARDAGFTDLVAEQRLSQPATTVARPDGGGYFMRVRATDDDGFVGPFTRPQRIEIPPRPWPWWPLLLLLPALI